MRLVQITPYDLIKVWDIFRYGLLQSVPGLNNKTHKSMQAILVNLLNQKAQGWVLIDGEDIATVVVTYIEHDKMTGYKYLFGYAMFNYRPVGREGWNVLSTGLDKFARGNGCKSIMFYTNTPDLKQGAEMFGFKVTNTILEREV